MYSEGAELLSQGRNVFTFRRHCQEVAKKYTNLHPYKQF